MSRAAGTVPFVALDSAADEPLHEQLYRAIRDLIVRGELKPRTRLAASRTLAADLGVSRFTVVTALDELITEGYLAATERGGTFVAETLPDITLKAVPRERSTASVPRSEDGRRALSRRGQSMMRVVISGPRETSDEPRPFRPRRPPLDIFPSRLWARLIRKQWRAANHTLLDYGHPAGLRELRLAIAEHARATRGVRCEAEQVIVTSGAQQAYNLLFQLLLDPGDSAWIEEPGYLDVRGALVAAGARLVPVPVDASGIDVEKGMALAGSASLAYVSPSHQYPLGVTLSASRRLRLLDWAHRTNAWIVEDDYDSYFRYSGRPLPSLQRLETDQLESGALRSSRYGPRVVYVGTFSKTMFPSLRLGYCIVPPSIVDAVANARAIADRNSSITDQVALTEFIRDGHYDRHLRRVRTACVERHTAMLESIERHVGGALTASAMNAGTHVISWLRTGRRSARRVAEDAEREGIVLFPLSRYFLTKPAQDGLVMGYGGLTPRLIDAGMRRLARVVR